MFEKGSLPKWSKEIHEIISNTKHTYTLDNNKTYKYYELMKVDDVQSQQIPTNSSSNTPSRAKLRKYNKVKRILRQEDINPEDIIEGKRQVKRSTKLKDYI